MRFYHNNNRRSCYLEMLLELSVVAKSIPSNSVAAGVPAKVIKSIEDYEKNVLERAVFISETDPQKRKELVLKAVEKHNS